MNIRQNQSYLFNRAKADFSNLISLVLFFFATAALFRSIEFALVVTASLGFHELGHAAALAWLRLDYQIKFGVVGAWTWSSSADRARLSQFWNTIVHLSGPIFSLLLALIAVGLDAAWRPASNHLAILANFSAQVGFLNLLPLGNLTDGGKAVRRVSAGLQGVLRLRAVILLFLLTVGMLVVYGLITLPEISIENARSFLLGLMLVGLWLASSLMLQSRQTEPGNEVLSQALRPGQVFLLILLIWDVLTFLLVVMSATPFWLAPLYVRGYIANVTWCATQLAQIVAWVQ